MPIHIRHKVNLQMYETTARKDCLFAPDDVLSEVLLDAFEREVSGRTNIIASGTEAIPFGDITAVRGLYIRCDSQQTMDIDINGLGTFTLDSGSSDAPIKVFLPAQITSLDVTNLSSTLVLTFTWALYGDASP